MSVQTQAKQLDSDLREGCVKMGIAVAVTAIKMSLVLCGCLLIAYHLGKLIFKER